MLGSCWSYPIAVSISEFWPKEKMCMSQAKAPSGTAQARPPPAARKATSTSEIVAGAVYAEIVAPALAATNP